LICSKLIILVTGPGHGKSLLLHVFLSRLDLRIRLLSKTILRNKENSCKKLSLHLFRSEYSNYTAYHACQDE